MTTLTIILQPTRKHPSTTQTVNLIHKIKKRKLLYIKQKKRSKGISKDLW